MAKIPFLKGKDVKPASGDRLASLVLKERLRVLKKTNLTDTGPISGTPRTNRRQRTHKVGEIHLPDGKTISCLVNDFSDSGMRLEITEEGVTPPDEFRLRVPTLEFDRRVRVVWRGDAAIGVGYST